MKKRIRILLLVVLVNCSLLGAEDTRELVEFPEMMQKHMLSNMRGHLESINEILMNMSNDNLDKAAEIAETHLGMSSLTEHGAAHLAKFMPNGMAKLGTQMHEAASEFALRVEEGDLEVAYKALTKLTNSCVACHSSYKIRF